MLLASIQDWKDLDREQLERSVAYTARSLNEAPLDLKQTNLGTFDAKAEGTTLVITLEKIPSGNEAFDPRMVRGVMYAMVCDGDALEGLIENGARIRFEGTTNTGKVLEPVTTTECP